MEGLGFRLGRGSDGLVYNPPKTRYIESPLGPKEIMLVSIISPYRKADRRPQIHLTPQLLEEVVVAAAAAAVVVVVVAVVIVIVVITIVVIVIVTSFLAGIAHEAVGN